MTFQGGPWGCSPGEDGGTLGPLSPAQAGVPWGHLYPPGVPTGALCSLGQPKAELHGWGVGRQGPRGSRLCPGSVSLCLPASLPHPPREPGRPDRRSSPWCWLRSPALKGVSAPTPHPTSGGALLGLTDPGSAPSSLGWWRRSASGNVSPVAQTLDCGGSGPEPGLLLRQNSPPETAAIPPTRSPKRAPRLRLASRAPLPSDAASSPAPRDRCAPSSDKRRENGSCGTRSCSCPSKPGAWKGGRVQAGRAVLAGLLKDG